MPTRQVSVRVSEDHLALADTLIPYVESLPGADLVTNVSRGSVLRLAVAEGLAVLDARRQAQEPAQGAVQSALASTMWELK